jgi:hypothetical protein
MTIEEAVALLAPLALALRVDLDAPTYRAYHKQLEKVPARLVDAALTDMSDGGLVFFPTAPQIKQAAEKKRRQLLAAHAYDGCPECEGHIGYRHRLESDNGQPTVEKCPCKKRWQAKLAGMGALEPVALLPGEEGVGENEQVFPTLEQLPEPIRQKVIAITGRRALR